MINGLALCLVFTSLLTAQVYSPNSKISKQLSRKEDVIVKEGHRVIVVETYDDEGGQHNRKVSISPPQDPISTAEDGKFLIWSIENAKEKIKHAVHVLPNIGQGISYGDHDQEQSRTADGGERHGPGERFCDALGKCKHKIARVIGKANDKVSEIAHDEAVQKKQKAHEVKAAQEAVHKKKRIAQEAKEVVEDSYEKAKDMAHDAKVVGEDAYEKTKDMASHKVHEVAEDACEKTKECARDVGGTIRELYGKAKEIAKSAKDLGKTMGSDAAFNLSHEVDKEAERMEKYLTQGFSFLGSTRGVKTLMGVINILGFATAYGMCVWVTFISSHVLAKALTRQQFGMVQSKIYPIYFRVMASCIGLALLGHLVGKRKLVYTRKAEMFQFYNLLVAILVVLINGIFLEPMATKVMFEKLKIEKEEGRGKESLAAESSRPEEERGAATTTAVPENSEQHKNISELAEKLKRLNSYSSLLNILTLMALTCYLVYLGHCLHVTC